MTVSIAITPVRRTPGSSRADDERIAVAEAVSRLFPGTKTTIGHFPDGAPFLAGLSDVRVSVSHSLTHAAVAVSLEPVGIDIEQPRSQLERVAPRFMSARELASAENLPSGLLRAWTAKEAVFKILREPGVDFTGDIVLSDDFSTARFRDRTTVYLTAFAGLPENNLLTVATLDRAPDITIL